MTEDLLHAIESKLNRFTRQFYLKQESDVVTSLISSSSTNPDLSQWHKILDKLDSFPKTDIENYCLKLVNLYFPNHTFTSLDQGSSAYIFTDHEHPDRLYKVPFQRKKHQHRAETTLDPDRLAYIDKEINNFAHLESTGLAPKLISVSGIEHTSHLMDTPTPIIVMERIIFDPNWNDRFTLDQLKQQAENVYHLLLPIHLVPGDIQFVWDKIAKRPRVVDLGGFNHIPNITPETLHQKVLTTYLGNRASN